MGCSTILIKKSIVQYSKTGSFYAGSDLKMERIEGGIPADLQSTNDTFSVLILSNILSSNCPGKVLRATLQEDESFSQNEAKHSPDFSIAPQCLNVNIISRNVSPSLKIS